MKSLSIADFMIEIAEKIRTIRFIRFEEEKLNHQL